MPYFVIESQNNTVRPLRQLVIQCCGFPPVIMLQEGIDPTRRSENQPLSILKFSQVGLVGEQLIPAEKVGDGLWLEDADGVLRAVAHVDWPSTAEFFEE